MITRDVKIGASVPSINKAAYQKALDVADFRPGSSHLDEYARTVGYSGALLSGYILCGYINEFMVNFFGEKWFYGGEISLSFINKGVRQHDKVTVKGTVVRTTEEKDAMRVFIDFWMEKEDGTKVVVGQANSLL